MEAGCYSETSVDFQQTTRRYIPEDITLHIETCFEQNFQIIMLHNIFVVCQFSCRVAVLQVTDKWISNVVRV
jgi:hypothetical protein